MGVLNNCTMQLTPTWSCKHCNNNFNFTRTTDKANHSKHCASRPGRQAMYESLVAAQRLRHDRELGAKQEYLVTCSTCSGDMAVTERPSKFDLSAEYYCSRSCSNSVGGKRKAQIYHTDDTAHYRIVAFRHHEKKCVCCGFDKIVAVHHVDENHNNNDPKNLVVLCPNCHATYHSKYQADVRPAIEKYLIARWSPPSFGTTALHANEVGGGVRVYGCTPSPSNQSKGLAAE